MTCPDCDGKIKTVDTVQTLNNETYRRKKCLECGRLIFTIEYDVEPDEKYRQDWQAASPCPWIRNREKANESVRKSKAKALARKRAEKEASKEG